LAPKIGKLQKIFTHFPQTSYENPASRIEDFFQSNAQVRPIMGGLPLSWGARQGQQAPQPQSNLVVLNLGHLDFEIVSDFDIRISDFKLSAT